MTMELTQSLEDYLETILELVRDRKVARVKDIATVRGVKPGSVSPAMRRLSDLGLIRYEQREFIDLTPKGEALARKVLARHCLLETFFVDILKMDREGAQKEACAMEHCLSDDGMERLSRLVDYLKSEGRFDLGSGPSRRVPDEPTLAHMTPGQEAVVTHIRAQGELRQQILELGLLPDSRVRMERMSADGSRCVVRLQGFEIELTREQSEAVQVTF